MPSHYKIFDYWKDKAITENGEILTEYGYAGCDENDPRLIKAEPVVCDWGEPMCFGCESPIPGNRYGLYEMPKYYEWLGDEENGLKKIWGSKPVTKSFQKAHIIPHALGGSDDDPSNYFLLCKNCHELAPDTLFKQEFIKWVFRRRKHYRAEAKYSWVHVAAVECLKNGYIPDFDLVKEKYDSYAVVLPKMVPEYNRIALTVQLSRIKHEKEVEEKINKIFMNKDMTQEEKESWKYLIKNSNKKVCNAMYKAIMSMPYVATTVQLYNDGVNLWERI